MLHSRMILLWIALVVAFGSSSLLSSQSPSETIEIPDATLVHLSLHDSLSSATNKLADSVQFQVTADVKVGQLVVIAKGSIASGHVAVVKPKTMLGRSGKLEFTVDHVKAADGSDVRLRASSTRTSEQTSSSLLAVPFNLVLGGKDVNIPKGTQFNSYVDGDQKFTMRQEKPVQETPAAVEASPPQTAQETSTVIVKSTPDGADIRVDGRYVGSTPSALQLPPGDHVVIVDKSGYKPWQRTMSLSSGGLITVDAQLEAQ